MPERRRISLAGQTGGRTSDSDKEQEAPQKPKVAGKKSGKSVLMAGDEPAINQAKEDDEEEVALPKGVKSKDGKRSNITLLLVAIPVFIVVIIAVVLIFGGRGRGEEAVTTVAEQTGETTSQQSSPENTQNTTQSVPELTDQEISESLGVGTQDFTKDTTMDTDPDLTDAEEYTKDIYGLTTRIDYSVDKILNVTDFVEYEKHRGTWGGGLELYWLEASYKNAKYVIQVPFKYYKELDDVGIVPVKMEVLTIEGEADGDDRTVISYMCLDEETLEAVMKTQSKATGN